MINLQGGKHRGNSKLLVYLWKPISFVSVVMGNNNVSHIFFSKTV